MRILQSKYEMKAIKDSELLDEIGKVEDKIREALLGRSLSCKMPIHIFKKDRICITV